MQLTSVLRTVAFSTNIIEGISRGVAGLASIGLNNPVASRSITYTVPITADGNDLIKDIDFTALSDAITQHRSSDFSRAFMSGRIVFGGLRADLNFTRTVDVPGLGTFGGVLGATEQPVIVPVDGTVHLDLPNPVRSTILTFSVDLNADEFGGVFDSFSSMRLNRWTANISTVTVPEPSSIMLLGTGWFCLFAYSRLRQRPRDD